MIQESISKISHICNTLPAQLKTIPELEFNLKLENKWSKKEILGHLVDSTMVNLQRFVRGQIENEPTIAYDQDKWVSVQQYIEYDNENLITFWESINRHLIHVISYIPAEKLQSVCLMKDGKALSLEFLIEDYYKHLQHHVAQLLS